MQKQRLNQLTFTRFLVILFVVFYHGAGGVYYDLLNFFPMRDLVHAAPSGVVYLYALSGFVMSLAYFRPQQKFSFQEYWKARFIRLYPLYLFAFLALCAYYADSVARIKLLKTLTNFLAIQAWFPGYAQAFNYPSWSVSVEFFFYLIFPLFAWWAARQSSRKIIWASVLFWACSQFIHNALWVLYFPAQERVLLYNPLFHLSSFLLGAAAGVWFLREGKTEKSNSWLMAFNALLIFLYIIYSPKVANIPSGIQTLMGVLAPFMTVAILMLAKDSTRLSSALSHPGLIALGEISYAFYIFHIPAKLWYELLLTQTGAAYLFNYTYVPLLLLFSFFAYYIIDLPLRKFLQPLMKRVNLLLFLVDFILFPAALYLSFRWRFSMDKEFASYQPMMILMFWSSLLIQTPLSALLGGFDLNSKMLLRATTSAVTLAALISGALVCAGYRLAWFVNFPRSVLLLNVILFLALSLLARRILQKFAA